MSHSSTYSCSDKSPKYDAIKYTVKPALVRTVVYTIFGAYKPHNPSNYTALG